MNYEMDKYSMVEINFVIEPGKVFAKVRAFAVPRKGELINIERTDYKVESVAWALDVLYEQRKALRAIVYLEPTNSKEVGE